jgi:hypothetical protein
MSSNLEIGDVRECSTLHRSGLPLVINTETELIDCGNERVLTEKPRSKTIRAHGSLGGLNVEQVSLPNGSRMKARTLGDPGWAVGRGGLLWRLCRGEVENR